MTRAPLTASAFADLLQSSLSSRTVFVKCVPAPKTFFERRAVLRTVQKLSHGTVETFKKLQDNSSYIVVTTKPGTAEGLVNDSPIPRTVISQDPSATNDLTTTSTSSWGAQYDLRGSITTPINPLPPSKVARTTPTLSELGITYINFTLHMFAANRSYSHWDVIKRDPLHGPWPPNSGTETFMSAALRQSIPSGAMAPALRDWHTANQLWRGSRSFMDEGAEGAATTLLGKKRLTPKEVFLMERIRARKNNAKIPAIMRSLADFADGKIRDELPDTATYDPENLVTTWRVLGVGQPEMSLEPRFSTWTSADYPPGFS
ncbi:hypothetical protein F5B19DRAFT_486662 [Rostrohypoxylon terebratum]|nr:hypothetical protein F5B19DRAFT_486662 [Rostrohypoxylon terebratum]